MVFSVVSAFASLHSCTAARSAQCWVPSQPVRDSSFTAAHPITRCSRPSFVSEIGSAIHGASVALSVNATQATNTETWESEGQRGTHKRARDARGVPHRIVCEDARHQIGIGSEIVVDAISTSGRRSKQVPWNVSSYDWHLRYCCGPCGDDSRCGVPSFILGGLVCIPEAFARTPGTDDVHAMGKGMLRLVPSGPSAEINVGCC